MSASTPRPREGDGTRLAPPSARKEAKHLSSSGRWKHHFWRSLADGSAAWQSGSAAEDAWWNLFAGRLLLIESIRSEGLVILLLRAHHTGRALAAPLRARHLEVLRRAARGEPGTSSALDLGVSPARVADMLKRGLKRIGLCSRAEVIWACREHEGLDPPGDLRLARTASGANEWVVLTWASVPAEIDAPFTPAERALLVGVAQGHTNREIARARGTSCSTVANQIASLCEKVDARSRHELVARSGAFGPSPPGPDRLPLHVVQRLAGRAALRR